MPDPRPIDGPEGRRAALRRRLEGSNGKEQVVAHEPAGAEIARIRWRLGLISDEGFRRLEAFYERFSCEGC